MLNSITIETSIYGMGKCRQLRISERANAHILLEVKDLNRLTQFVVSQTGKIIEGLDV
jgi:hypothetical protein